MVRELSLVTGVALLGCVIAGVLVGTDAARWAGAFIAIIAFKAGYLYARQPVGKERKGPSPNDKVLAGRLPPDALRQQSSESDEPQKRL